MQVAQNGESELKHKWASVWGRTASRVERLVTHKGIGQRNTRKIAMFPTIRDGQYKYGRKADRMNSDVGLELDASV